METKALRSGYEKISSAILTILFVALPLLVIPFTNVSFFYAKFGLVTLAVLIALVLLVIQIINERRIGRPAWIYTVAAVILPAVYLVSALFSGDTVSSLIGLGVDLDTFFFILLGSLVMILTARSFRQKQSAFYLNLSFLAVSSVIGLFHLLRYAMGPDFLSFGLFTSITANTIGSFSDLGIYAGLALIISMLSLEFLPVKGFFRVGFYVSLVISALMAIVSNFFIIDNLFGLGISISLTFILALVAVVIFVHKKVTNPKSVFPYLTLAVFLVMLVCSVQARQIAQVVVTKIGIQQAEILDIRVSPSATLAVAGETLSEGVVSSALGTGPNNFYQAWARHKDTAMPNSVNITNFWNTDFNLGSGFIPTAFVTTGATGILGWAFFLFAILFYIYKLFRTILQSQKDPVRIYSSLTASIATVYLWIMAIFYTPGPVILVLAFFFTGLLGSLLFKEEVVEVTEVSWDEAGYWRSFAIVFGLVVALALFISAGYVWTTKLLASIEAQRSVAIVQRDPTAITEAQASLARAVNWSASDGYLRFYSDISLIRPSQLIAESGGVVDEDDITEVVATDINRALAAANEAAIGNGASLDYRNWLQLGKVYEAATFLGATSTATLAAEAYARAELLNPTHPTPPYLLGRLFMYAQNVDVARAKLERSLTLKPNYSEALELYNSLPKSGQRQGISGAVNSTTTSTSTRATSTATSTR